MTIYHRSMLAGAAVIAAAEDDPQLNQVLLESSGEVVAVSKWALAVFSPVLSAITRSLPLTDKPLAGPVAVSVSQITDLCKAIPVDKQFKTLLEHISITNGDGNILNATFNNGRGNQSVILRSIQASSTLVSWRSRFRALGKPLPGAAVNFVFNRARLKTVVACVETACRYSGEFDFVNQKPFENGYVWSVKNGLTGQAVVVAWVLPSAGETPLSDWERNLFTAREALRRPGK